MPHSSSNDALPYASFLALDQCKKAITVTVAVAAVVASGLVSASAQIGGGTGWPVHNVLHPILGLFLGPVYGPASAVVGTGGLTVLYSYTAVNGWAPLTAGVSSLVCALLVREDRRATLLWGGGVAIACVGVAMGEGAGVGTGGMRHMVLPMLLGLGLAALPPVRSWCRRHLSSAGRSWRTAAALYGVCFMGAAAGGLSLWGLALVGGAVSGGMRESLLSVVVIQVGGPFVSMLLGMILWPMFQGQLFSVANQLRYGLPLFILVTVLLVGQLFVDQAYRASRKKATERLHEQSRVVARALDRTLRRIPDALHATARAEVPVPATASVQTVEYVGEGEAGSLSAGVRSLVHRTRQAARPQRAFLKTTTAPIGMAVPLRGDSTAARAPENVERIAVARLGTTRLREIWGPIQGQLYLVDRHHRPVGGEGTSASGTTDPVPLVEALLAAPDSTAEAEQGLYGANVIGAATPLSGLAGYVVVEQEQEAAYRHLFSMLLTIVCISLLACAGALSVGIYVSARIITPLDRIIEAARQVGEGDFSVRVTVDQENELGELAEAFNTMTGDLSASIRHLRENEERLRIALDAAQMGTWNWTAASETLRWSPQTYVLLGVDPARTERLYEAFLACVHPADRSRVVEQIRAVLRNQTSFAIEHRLQSEDGAVRWVRLQGQVYRKGTCVQRVSGVLMDITSQKNAEQELMAAKEEAEEMSRLKSAFLANVSHEIRTPLTAIIGYADMLEDEVSSAHQDGVEKILQSSRRLKRTLNSVLDLSRIEAGEFTLDCCRVDVAEEVHRQANLFRPMAEREGLDLIVDVPDELVEAKLDPNCLDRILTNLLTNAIKFTETGYVVVRVRATGRTVTLQVIDSGIGISEEFRSELFDAFRQESRGLQREHDGTGLGLSITKEMVELMEGQIEVESEKGEGTTVTVRLPDHVSEETKPVPQVDAKRNARLGK